MTTAYARDYDLSDIEDGIPVSCAAREQRGLALAAAGAVTTTATGWTLKGRGGVYTVALDCGALCCTCPDFCRRGVPCKHVYAVETVREREAWLASHYIDRGTLELLADEPRSAQAPRPVAHPIARTTRELVTPSQLSHLAAAARRTGADVEALCAARSGCAPWELSREAARRLLEVLR
jgi:hypothetical protein